MRIEISREKYNSLWKADEYGAWYQRKGTLTCESEIPNRKIWVSPSGKKMTLEARREWSGAYHFFASFHRRLIF